MSAFDISRSGSVLSNRRLLSNLILYFYDGVDVIDPEPGFTLGTVRDRDGKNLAVNISFWRNKLWIVGQGGVTGSE